MFSKKIQFLACTMILALGGLLFVSDSASSRSLGVIINGGRQSTPVRQVTLRLTGPLDAAEMRLSNDSYIDDEEWEPYRRDVAWTLWYGNEIAGDDDRQDVFVQFRRENGDVTNVFSDDIKLDPPEIEVVVTLAKTEPIRERLVLFEFDLSEGIDAFRVGLEKDLSAKRFQAVTDQYSLVVPQGSGKKTVYFEFKDASGETVKKTVSFEYEETGRVLEVGSLVKGLGPAIYYNGADGYLHPFLDGTTYNTWYTDFSDITVISDVALQQYEIGSPVCLRQGTQLLKFKGLNKVYAVEPGCRLRPVRSETEAYIFYGPSWGKRVVEMDPIYRSLYTIESFDASIDAIEEEDERDDIDNDGLDHVVEAQYGSSDRSEDTDGDGVSDYEEVYYWLTDPARFDTDGDGFGDGREIRMGYSPLGGGRLERIPEDTYVYPEGSLVQTESGTIYYMGKDNARLSIGKSTGSSFKSYRFRTQFVAPVLDGVLPSRAARLRIKTDTIKEPHRRVGDGELTPL